MMHVYTVLAESTSPLDIVHVSAEVGETLSAIKEFAPMLVVPAAHFIHAHVTRKAAPAEGEDEADSQ